MPHSHSYMSRKFRHEMVAKLQKYTKDHAKQDTEQWTLNCRQKKWCSNLTIASDKNYFLKLLKNSSVFTSSLSRW